MTVASFRSSSYAWRLNLTHTRKSNQNENVRPRGVQSNIFLPCATQDVHPLERVSSHPHRFSQNWTFFNGKQRNQGPSWQIANQSHVFSKRNYSTVTLECMWLYIATKLRNSTQLRISYHSSRHPLQAGIQSSGEDPSQNPWRHTNDNKLRWKHVPRMSLMKISSSSCKLTTKVRRKVKPLKEKINLQRAGRKGSIWGIILIGTMCLRIYQDRQKHQVVFFDWNKSNSTTTGRARRRSGAEDCEFETSRSTLWRQIDDTLQSKQRSHNP